MNSERSVVRWPLWIKLLAGFVLVALVAVGTLRAISGSAEMLQGTISTAAEVRFAAQTIARDLQNVYRDVDQKNNKFVGTVDDTGEVPSCSLTFYTVGRTKARIDQPEGDIYEVEYLLLKDEENSALTRRWWPNPDPNAQEPHGVLSVIAENIDVFQVRYFDGEDWQQEWPEEMRSVPDVVEVLISAQVPGRNELLTETVMVNLVRAKGTELGSTEMSNLEQ